MVTDTYSKLDQAHPGSFALDVDVAVIVSGVHGDHSAVVADPGGREVPVTVERRLGADQRLERFGPVLGVGDAIWRALSAVSAEIVCAAHFCGRFVSRSAPG